MNVLSVFFVIIWDHELIIIPSTLEVDLVHFI